MSSSVPVAVFGYARAKQLERTLAGLAANNGFADHPIHLFLDGARGDGDGHRVSEVLAVARRLEWPNLTLHVADSNRGLKRSVIAGVSDLVAHYGCAIVIEDDLQVSPIALDYFSAGLKAFEAEQRVKAVCGYMYRLDAVSREHPSFFLPFASSWGWATWQRAWEPFVAQATELTAKALDPAFLKAFDRQGIIAASTMLKGQDEGLIDSWAILWNAYLCETEGLALFPGETMILNGGFADEGATHASSGNPINRLLVRLNQGRALADTFELPSRVAVDEQMRAQVAGSWEARLHRVSTRLGYVKRKMRRSMAKRSVSDARP